VTASLKATFIEVAGGAAAFTGIDSPLTTVKGIGPHLSPYDLDEIELFFRDHATPTVTIEAAPRLTEESIRILSERGYLGADREDVVSTTSGASIASSERDTEALPSSVFPELMLRGFELPDKSPMRELATAAAQLPGAQAYGIREIGHWIACAQSAPYDEVVIFGNDATLPEGRRRGAQTALIEARLRALPTGKIVMAEVEPDSGSERNYLRCGFRIEYVRTHYVLALS
jgi:hypothetical protein